ncbi:MAG: hypothetical protein KGJ57_15975 [Sphingomonadales bacterium]|nr:hypothetical protein [Sphingomonadales bacterium]MDE2170901.1 hypothetical protein [Sphingomonadales bacterium]
MLPLRIVEKTWGREHLPAPFIAPANQRIRPTPSARHRIMRYNQLLEPIPRHHSSHLIQKYRTPRLFAGPRHPKP